MRVFSRSQGRFIDTAETEAVASQPSGMTSIGVPDEKLRNTFFKMTLANPKSKDVLSTAYNYVKPQETDTAEMKNRREALRPASSALSRVEDKWLDKLGPQNKFAEVSLKVLGGLGVDDTTKDLDSKFQLLKQNVVRALQGARMSDQDIALAMRYIPNISDTPSYARIKIKNLKDFMADLQGNTAPATQTKKSSPWEVIK